METTVMLIELLAIGFGAVGLSLMAISIVRGAGSKKQGQGLMAFKTDAMAVGSSADLDAFLDRWRGKLPAKKCPIGVTEAGEDVMWSGTIGPGAKVEWPSEIDYPCWFEYRWEDETSWIRMATTIATPDSPITNRSGRFYYDCRIVRRKSQ